MKNIFKTFHTSIKQPKYILLKVMLVIGFYGNTQIQFEQITQPIIANFSGEINGGTAFADIDNDLDLDVLITGYNGSGVETAKLYKNDGLGNYTIVLGTPFDIVGQSTVDFSDIDNDNDDDVLITGRNNAGVTIAKLYANNGSGVFTLIVGTPFQGVRGGSVAFSDIDNDNDPDLLITGKNPSNQPSSKLYLNNGTGNFTLVTGTPFEGLISSSIAFSDIDNDNDKDVLITGLNATNQPIAKLYLNNGMGIFTFLPGTPFTGIQTGAIAFSDVDNDNDNDLLMSGQNLLNQAFTGLYLNDGIGNYTISTMAPFVGLFGGSISFLDIDNDSDEDVFMTGTNSSSISLSRLYKNDGLGNYTLDIHNPFIGINGSTITVGDIDNDGDKDMLIVATLYVNDGMGHFYPDGPLFTPVSWSAVAIADVDNDNDKDVLISGNNNGQPLTKLYLGNGQGDYYHDASAIFENLDSGDIAFSDIDNDNDQDVLITGKNNASQRMTKLYLNDGFGNYSLAIGTPFEGLAAVSMAFSDIDNDNDNDLLITGANSANDPIIKLYVNDGLGNFTLVIGTPFVAVHSGSIAFADVDNDNDQDVFITGHTSTSLGSAKLYLNNGLGSFTFFNSGSTFINAYANVANSDIAFADVDNDNDQDLFITGLSSVGNLISKLFLNDGVGNYTVQNSSIIETVDSGTVVFSDLDNDNDMDLLITGTTTLGLFDGIYYYSYTANLYTNNGFGIYSLVLGSPLVGVADGAIAFADIDIDNDLDVIITGGDAGNTSNPTANYYRNISCFFPNTGNDIITACNSLTWIDGITYTSSNNTATFTLTNIAGCDSVVTLNLTINHSNIGTDILTACDSHTWIDGITYTSSNNTALFTTTNVAGCDSVVTLNLTINYSNTGTDIITSCNSHTWIDGITYTSSNNTATFTLSNVAGCDSVVTLDLAIYYSNTGTDIITACNSYTWIDGITYTSSNNTATFTLTNVAGCDSVVTLNLTMPSGTLTNVGLATTSFCAGTLEAAMIGGTAPYYYAFNYSPSQLSSTLTNACAGFNFVTITDAVGCSAVADYYLPFDAVAIPLTADVLVTATSETGLCNGAAEVLVTSGTAPYTFVHSTGVTTALAAALCEGVYSVTITDAVGATVTLPYMVATDTNTLFLYQDGASNAYNTPPIGAIENCNVSYFDVDSVTVASVTSFAIDSVTVVWNVYSAGLLEVIPVNYYIGFGLGYYNFILDLYCPTKSNGKFLKVTAKVHVSSLVNLHENASFITAVYPNPFTGNFTISLAKVERYTISLLDLSGRTLFTKVYDNTNLIELSQLDYLAKGEYLLRVERADGVIIKKVTK